ncbi:MAG: aldose epimerase family protein [Pseudomonadota bacterium]
MSFEPISKRHFGQLRDGRDAELYTLTNRNGARVALSNYGSVITDIQMPDRYGRLGGVVLNYPSLGAYEDDELAIGAFVGRFANRIAGGLFSIDGVTYQLPLNHGAHHIHGGINGFGKQLWSAEPQAGEGYASIILRRCSEAGEEGYPGTLELEVIYTLNDSNALTMDVRATTDHPTVVNVTQHSYFNLAGDARSVLGHQLFVDADEVLPIDTDLIPTGQACSVEGTPFDFRRPKAIGQEIDAANQQLAYGQGYDHCFVLNVGDGPAARLTDPVSGRVLLVYTDQPGMQVYSGNWLCGPFTPRSGLCLETQHFPDSPNHAGFPTTVLRPGQVFQTRTRFQFDVKKD